MDATQRHQLQVRFAQARLAERGEYDPDRGGNGPARGEYDPDRGEYDPDRGEYDPDRGEYDPDRGSPGSRYGVGGTSQAAADILRRAVGLGGHLVVAFVSPVGASPVSRRRSRQPRPCELTITGARTLVTQLIELKMARARELRNKPSSQAEGRDTHGVTTPSTYTTTGQTPPRVTGP